MACSVSHHGEGQVFITSLIWEALASISSGDMGPAPERVVPQAGLTGQEGLTHQFLAGSSYTYGNRGL